MKKAIILAVLIGLGTQYMAPRAAFSGEEAKAEHDAEKANEKTVEAQKDAAKANRAAFHGREHKAGREARKSEEAQVDAAKDAEKAAEHADKARY